MKKTIIIVGAILVVLLLIVGVPLLIQNAKHKEAQKIMEKEIFAEEKAKEITKPVSPLGKKLGVTGGDAGYGGQYTDKAKKNADKAMMRSADYLKNLEDEENNEDDF